MDFQFERLAEIPWSPAGLRELVVPIGLGGFGEAQRYRLKPVPFRAPDGTVWLATADGQVGAVRNGGWQPFSIDPAGADLITLAPAPDGGVVVLGRKGTDNVLARLDAGGALLWRRTGAFDAGHVDVAALRGDFTSLPADEDGAIYLPGTRIAGQVARVDLRDGATPPVVDLGSYRASVWIRGGALFRVTFADGARSWVRREIATGKETFAVADATLQEALSLPRAVTPDGGALLTDDLGLVWMAPDGAPAARLPLSGVVRTEDGIAVAQPEGDGLRITRWTGGAPAESCHTGAPAGALLIHASAASVLLAQPGTPALLLELDRQCNQRGSEPLDEPHRLELEGSVDVTRPLVEPDGSVILVGVDRAGCYLVRIRRTAPI